MPRTGENIYKRKDGRWEARIIVEYDPNGKAKYKYLYAKTYSEVKAKMIHVHTSIESTTTIITNKEASYESWLIRWLQSKKIQVKSSTYIRYRNIIESHIIPALGKYPINRIGTSMMENFVSNKLTHGRLDGNGGLSPKTMSDILTIIKESFKYAQVSGALTVCRFDGICFKQNAQEMRVLSVFEQQQLLSVLFDDFDRYKMGVFIQVQEMLKLLHADRKLPTLAGKGYVFNGLTHDSYVVEYQRKDDCMSHDIYEKIIEKPWSARTTSLRGMLAEIRGELGEKAVLDFDRDIATTAKCSCGENKALFTPVHKLKGEMLTCPKCGAQMTFDSVHSIAGDENFLDKTPMEIGIPLLHIVGGRVGMDTTYYEFTSDEAEVFENL